MEKFEDVPLTTIVETLQRSATVILAVGDLLGIKPKKASDGSLCFAADDVTRIKMAITRGDRDNARDRGSRRSTILKQLKGA